MSKHDYQSVDDRHDDEHSEHSEEFALPHLIFLIFVLFSAVMTRFVLESLSSRRYKPPFTVMMGLWGVLLGIVNTEGLDEGGLWHQSIRYWSEIHPEFIFYVLLPPLLFESAFSMKWHVFQKQAFSSIMLAGPGILLGVMMTMCVAKGLWGELDWGSAGLIGSILSATDPVAVVAVLHTLGAPAKLSHLIEGESLLNDGSAYVVFAIFKEIAASVDVTPGDAVLRFLQLSVGGPLWGLAMGCAAAFVMRLEAAATDPMTEITTLVCGVYTTFFLAEHHLGVSGVLAVVVFGVYLGKERALVVGRAVEHRNHEFWEMVGFLSNSLIFVLSGLIVHAKLRRVDWSKLGAIFGGLVAMYIALHVIRGLMVEGLRRAGLKSCGYGIGPKESAVMIYSGLRGAVGLALAMEVEHDVRIPKAVRETIIVQVGGIVALTLLINGTTAGLVYEWLNPYPEPPYRESLAVRALVHLDVDVHGDNSRHLCRPATTAAKRRSSTIGLDEDTLDAGLVVQAGGLRAGLLQHLADSPFHGFADFETVVAILPDLTRLTRVGHVIMLDRSDPTVNSRSVEAVLKALETKYWHESGAMARNGVDAPVSREKTHERSLTLRSRIAQSGARALAVLTGSSAAISSVAPAPQASERLAPSQTFDAPADLQAWVHAQRTVALEKNTTERMPLTNTKAPRTPHTLQQANSMFGFGPTSDTGVALPSTSADTLVSFDGKDALSLDTDKCIRAPKGVAVQDTTAPSAAAEAEAAEATPACNSTADAQSDSAAEALSEGDSSASMNKAVRVAASGAMLLTMPKMMRLAKQAKHRAKQSHITSIVDMQEDLKAEMENLMRQDLDEAVTNKSTMMIGDSGSTEDAVTSPGVSRQASRQVSRLASSESSSFRESATPSLSPATSKRGSLGLLKHGSSIWRSTKMDDALHEDVKTTVCEVVLKAMEMRLQAMYEAGTLSPTAYSRLCEAIDVATDSLLLAQKDGPMDPEAQVAQAALASPPGLERRASSLRRQSTMSGLEEGGCRWNEVRSLVSDRLLVAPFQVAWSFLERANDHALDKAVASAKWHVARAMLERFLPHQEEALCTSVQALMGFIAAVEKVTRTCASAEFARIFEVSQGTEALLAYVGSEQDHHDNLHVRCDRHAIQRESSNFTLAPMGPTSSELTPLQKWLLKQLSVVKLQAYGALAAMRIMFPAELRVIHTTLAVEIALNFMRNKAEVLCEQGLLSHHTLADITEVIKERQVKTRLYRLQYYG